LASPGVLARSVEDAELMLDVLIGPDNYDPTSRMQPDGYEPSNPRLGVSADLGVARISHEVATVFHSAVERMAALFPCIEARAPDCTGGQDAFETLRAAMVWRNHRKHWDEHRELLTEPAHWNIARGEGITADQFLRAEERRSVIYRSFIKFFEENDFLVTLSASVLPFPNTQAEVLEIDGVPLRNPLDYLTITYLITLVGMPCLSIPCGWTAGGLPVGMQIVGPPLSERRLLAFAKDLQDRLDFRHRWPV
jgi:amidase